MRFSPLSIAASMFMVFALVAVSGGGAAVANPTSAHDFTFTSIEGEALPLKPFAGRAVLIVNTASLCGFTPQYEDLQALWERYRERGLTVIGVPSNDFGGQEPGSEAKIKEFCEVNFNIDFPLTQKEHVRGSGAHPFYLWAEQELGADRAPQWNFHKYLIGPDGRLVAAFPSSVTPTSDAITQAVERSLADAPRRQRR